MLCRGNIKMKDNKLYVIQFNNGSFWCGYNNYDPQLRKARIYTSYKMANEAGETCLKRLKGVKSFEVIEVELKIMDKEKTNEAVCSKK